MTSTIEVRKIGNSLGVLFPKEFVKKNHLKLKEKVFIDIVRETDISSIFGKLKRKTSGQEFKDLVRAGWQ